MNIGVAAAESVVIRVGFPLLRLRKLATVLASMDSSSSNAVDGAACAAKSADERLESATANAEDYLNVRPATTCR